MLSTILLVVLAIYSLWLGISNHKTEYEKKKEAAKEQTERISRENKLNHKVGVELVCVMDALHCSIKSTVLYFEAFICIILLLMKYGL